MGLLDLCNRAAACIEDDSPEGMDRFRSILFDLGSYVDIHFQTEEKLLKENHYPLLDEQQEEHADYAAKMDDFLLKATFGVFDRVGLHQYLSHWWLHHILESDMQYKDFLLEISGRRGADLLQNQ